MGRSGTRVPTADQFCGALLGLAIGDALGRPVEGKRQDEIRALQGESLLAFRAYHERRFPRPFPRVLERRRAAGPAPGGRARRLPGPRAAG